MRSNMSSTALRGTAARCGAGMPHAPDSLSSPVSPWISGDSGACKGDDKGLARVQGPHVAMERLAHISLHGLWVLPSIAVRMQWRGRQ